MPIEFAKFKIKKSSWWKVGNFDIFDENEDIVYKVQSRYKNFSLVTTLQSVNFNVEYKIEKAKQLKISYNLYEEGKLIAKIDKPINWNAKAFEIESAIVDPFILKGNMWSNEYRFIRNEEEFGIVSHKIWSNGTFGIAIKDGEHIPMILSVVIIVALLKASGLA
ncbi:MAG: hypothetical protein HKN51_07835 [Saprospiraceae bacterium]|nr:hypothetical protein [Saprospiraceae bacterium]